MNNKFVYKQRDILVPKQQFKLFFAKKHIAEE